MASFSQSDGEAFFAAVAQEVALGQAALLAARIGGRILGTVNLGLATPPNQPHRADVRKLLVHRDARGRGVGQALVQEVERLAARRGRTLLVLDTVTGEAGDPALSPPGLDRGGRDPGLRPVPWRRALLDHHLLEAGSLTADRQQDRPGADHADADPAPGPTAARRGRPRRRWPPARRSACRSAPPATRRPSSAPGNSRARRRRWQARTGSGRDRCAGDDRSGRLQLAGGDQRCRRSPPG